jgi:hypothetical protein
MPKGHGYATYRSGRRNRTYDIWAGMLTRCRNPKRKEAKNYIERGIDFDPRWANFLTFLADMGECPPGLTLERRDNSRGYWPDNCEWATRRQQTRNSRHCVHVVVDGQPMILVDALGRLGSNWGYYRSLRWGKYRRMTAQEAVDHISRRRKREPST